MSDMYIIRNYIIVFAILLAPIILIVSGLILRKSKKNLSTGLLIAGGIYLGLLFLVPLFLTLLNFITI